MKLPVHDMKQRWRILIPIARSKKNNFMYPHLSLFFGKWVDSFEILNIFTKRNEFIFEKF